MVKKEETRMKEKLQVTGPIIEGGIKRKNARSFHHWKTFTRVVFLKEDSGLQWW